MVKKTNKAKEFNSPMVRGPKPKFDKFDLKIIELIAGKDNKYIS